MLNNNDNLKNVCYLSQACIKISRWTILFAAVVALPACVMQEYVPEPIDVQQSYQEIIAADHRDEGFREFLRNNAYPVLEWPIKEWSLQALTLAAVYFNPSIQVAKSELAIQQANRTIASQRPNPTLGIPLEHHSDSGDSPWLIGVVTDFLFERSDKREAKLQQAVAKIDAAKINIEQQTWSLYSSIHKALIEYFAAKKQKELLIAQQDLLKENLGLLERRQELGQISPFEVSSVRLELQHIQLRISDQDYLINDAFHNLVANTGLQTDRFNQQEFSFDSLNNNISSQVIDDKQLRETALNNRFDVRIKLKDYEAYESALKLEILKQYPDLNLSPGFIFEQGDRIWALGAAWVLPLFHNNEGQIQEALATRANMQAEFIQLQTLLVNELDRKHQNYIDKLASYKNTLTLVDELKDRAVQVRKQFDLGYADKLSVVRAELEIEKARQAIFAIEVDLMRAKEQIERLTQQPLYDEIDIKVLTENIILKKR